MAKPQIFNRDMKRLAYLDNALAVGYGLEFLLTPLREGRLQFSTSPS